MLWANPDTTIFGPNVGYKSYDVAMVSIRNRSKSAISILGDEVDHTAKIDVTGVFFLPPEGPSHEAQCGVEQSPFKTDGIVDKTLVPPLKISENNVYCVLVRIHLTAPGSAGIVRSVALQYAVNGNSFYTKYLMPAVLCFGSRLTATCKSFESLLPGGD
jgi:hypothetical protein